MSDVVLLSREGDIATVTLNRPDRLNALDKAMWQRLAAIMAEVAADGAIRCVILRGAGAAFGAGADVAEFASERDTPAKAAAYAEIMGAALSALRDCPVPTVAQIHGACAGAGLEVAIHCDLRIAGDGSKFGAPVQRLGITMPYPEIAALMELVGRATTIEILLEGRMFGAREAYEKGLVCRVVPDSAVEEEARATRAPDCRWRPARPPLAQEVRAPVARSAAAVGGRDRGILCRLRHRGLSNRHRGFSGQGEAAVPGALIGLPQCCLHRGRELTGYSAPCLRNRSRISRKPSSTRFCLRTSATKAASWSKSRLGDAAAGARRIDDIDVAGVIGMEGEEGQAGRDVGDHLPIGVRVAQRDPGRLDEAVDDRMAARLQFGDARRMARGIDVAELQADAVVVPVAGKQDRQPIVAAESQVDVGKLRGQCRAHVAIEMGGVNPSGQRRVDLQRAVRPRRRRDGRDRGPRVPSATCSRRHRQGRSTFDAPVSGRQR